MKKILQIIIIALFPTLLYSQIEGVVVDSKNGKPIPYVNIWVENENIGVSSDINGEFIISTELKSPTLLLSSIGYNQKKVKCANHKLEIRMDPKVFQISEITVIGQFPKEHHLGQLKSSLNRHFYCCTEPWIVGNVFSFKDKYSKTPYFKKIGFLTTSKIDSAIFQIRVYSLKENGEIGSCLHNEPIYGFAKKGLKKTYIDVSKYNLRFSELGIMVAVEWIIIESNKHIYMFNSTTESEENKPTTVYEPSFSMNKKKRNKEMWEYNGGWKRKEQIGGTIQTELILYNKQ